MYIVYLILGPGVHSENEKIEKPWNPLGTDRWKLAEVVAGV